MLRSLAVCEALVVLGRRVKDPNAASVHVRTSLRLPTFGNELENRSLKRCRGGCGSRFKTRRDSRSLRWLRSRHPLRLQSR